MVGFPLAALPAVAEHALNGEKTTVESEQISRDQYRRLEQLSNSLSLVESCWMAHPPDRRKLLISQQEPVYIEHRTHFRQCGSRAMVSNVEPLVEASRPYLP